MTAFAISLEPRKLIVAGDTLAYTPDRHDGRPLGFISKVIPLPHINSVMFSRGMYQITMQAAAKLMLSPFLMSIEAAASGLAAVLRDCSKAYAAEHSIADYTAFGLLELVLAGWSKKQKRMRLWYYTNHTAYEPEEGTDRLSGVSPFPRLAPHHMPRLAGLERNDQLVRMVQAIGRSFSTSPGMAGMRIGGEIIAYELTPEGMSMRVLHRFSDYTETKHAAAATANRIERGDLTVSVADGLVPIAQVVNAATGKSVAA
jgi:hypothetical protein